MAFTDTAWARIQRTAKGLPFVSIGEFGSRNKVLRREGFLEWERYHLSQHDIETPGMRYMRRERIKMYRDADVSFDTFNDWQKQVSRMYRQNNWFFRDHGLNPFLMLESFKVESNSPDTPQPKQPSKTKDFATAKAITEVRGTKPRVASKSFASRLEAKRGR